jgi:hypothetical protein
MAWVRYGVRAAWYQVKKGSGGGGADDASQAQEQQQQQQQQQQQRASQAGEITAMFAPLLPDIIHKMLALAKQVH